MQPGHGMLREDARGQQSSAVPAATQNDVTTIPSNNVILYGTQYGGGGQVPVLSAGTEVLVICGNGSADNGWVFKIQVLSGPW